ncbi:GNAT family N-acetyltransferase [Cryobacterium melibiosiphilum]|uniref:GNAT family N-acetyltransferase n=1 Tax=Cryobacterium melibiosiphilum TaxID=995039 RepID=A0A3A5MSV3_9MICO|nr:GNAT family N-acetyltransferase [Cryobacterium melibiosiphilum]RJT89016.1 GNAT family N-acetyltransferase [Cryobacterium melibiosiphilum]
MSVRLATAADLPTIRALLRTHAETEGGLAGGAARADDLDAALTGEHPSVRVTIVSLAAEPSVIAGIALWYPTFSSWALTTGIWLEDLFIDDSYRNAGLGLELMNDLRARTTGRIEWEVSRGNDGAERFYRKLGAAPRDGFTQYRWLPRA